MSSFSEAVSEIIVAKDPMVSVEWLHKNLRNPNIKVLFVQPDFFFEYD